MPSNKVKDTKLGKIWRYTSKFLLAFCIIYFYPDIKRAFFPSQMARLDKMLKNTSMAGYRFAVDGDTEYEIALTIFNGSKSITTQIYRDVLKELEPTGDNRIFLLMR